MGFSVSSNTKVFTCKYKTWY